MNRSDLVAKAFPKYKSKSEEDWAEHGIMILELEKGLDTVWQVYEPATFKLPGNSYTPDFMHLLVSGEIVWVEVKGSKYQKNYRNARSKLRAAAAIFPFWIWIEAVGSEMDWKLEVIE